MMLITDKAMSAAHQAFEEAARDWQMAGVKDRHAWQIYYDPPVPFTAVKPNEITYHIFEDRRQALFFLRDKCLRAAIDAVMIAMEIP